MIDRFILTTALPKDYMESSVFVLMSCNLDALRNLNYETEIRRKKCYPQKLQHTRVANRTARGFITRG